MATTDWLTTLLSGVSGAFTGYGQANERRSSAAELARQIARQTELDARAQQQDAARQFSQGLQDEAALTNLGYVRGDVPKQFSGASMALPGMGAFNVGSAVDAMRVGPSRTASDGTKFTLDRAQTPQAKAMRASEMEREAARAVLRERVDSAWDIDNERGVRINKRTGEVRPLSNLPPRPAPASQSSPLAEEMSEQRRFQREQSLAQDFRSEQAIKDASGIAGAVATINGALANPSPQGDLAAIYALVKLYDPGSVVREGEISLTQSAASLPEQVRRLYAGWNTGKKLTPQMKEDMASVAANIVAERQTQIAPILQRYGQQARRWGADSAYVAPNPLGNTSGAASPAAAAAADIFNNVVGARPPRPR